MNRIVAIAALAALALLASCATDPTTGYSTATVFPDHIRTIAVPIPENDSFIRDVEFDLAAALVTEIEARTPYKVAAHGRADSVLEARVRQVDLDQISSSRNTGLGEEVILSVTIDFAWRDLARESTLVERRSFTGHGLFVPSRPSSERIELGRFAAVQQLARDVVSEMQAPW